MYPFQHFHVQVILLMNTHINRDKITYPVDVIFIAGFWSTADL